MADPIETSDGYLRLAVEDVLSDHASCVRWARMGKLVRTSVSPYQGDRAARIAKLMEPHGDIIKAATDCVAGRGHH